MKHLITLVTFLLVSTSVFAQENSEPQGEQPNEYLDENEFLNEDEYLPEDNYIEEEDNIQEEEEEYIRENEYYVEIITSPEEASENESYELDVRNVLKVNFFGMFGRSFTGEFERVINKKFSVQLAVGYRHINLDWIVTDPITADEIDFYQSGFTFVPEVKYYWTNFSNTLKTPTGSYLAPFARIGYYDMNLIDNYYDEYDVTYNLTSISGGVVMGFQVLAGRVFAVDAFVGPQFKYKFVSNVRWEKPGNAGNDVVTIDSPGFIAGIRLGVTVGVAF